METGVVAVNQGMFCTRRAVSSKGVNTDENCLDVPVRLRSENKSATRKLPRP